MLLLAVASPIEVRGVFAAWDTGARPVPALWATAKVCDRTWVLHTGVGKTNAAGSLSKVLTGGQFGAVINVGIGGSLPSEQGQGIGPCTAVAGSVSVFADEGILAPDGFQSLAAMGFPMDPTLVEIGTHGSMEGIRADSTLLEAFRAAVDMEGPIATVSTCSGTDAAAQAVHNRTGAVAEGMEGAALALVARRFGVPFCELRTISNDTGDRAGQQWNIPGALGRLQEVLKQVVV